jgi:hypothetical protein
MMVPEGRPLTWASVATGEKEAETWVGVVSWP